MAKSSSILLVISTIGGLGAAAYFALKNKFSKDKIIDDGNRNLDKQKINVMAEGSKQNSAIDEKNTNADVKTLDFNYDSVEGFSPQEVQELPSSCFSNVKLQNWSLSTPSNASKSKKADSPYTTAVAESFSSSRALIIRQVSKLHVKFDKVDGDLFTTMKSKINRTMAEYIGV